MNTLIGQHQGIPLPEPDDIVFDLKQDFNVLDVLRQERELLSLQLISKTPDNWIKLKAFLKTLDIDTLHLGVHPIQVLDLPETVKYNFASLLAVFSLLAQKDDSRRLALLKKLYISMGLTQEIAFFLKQAKQMDTDVFGDQLNTINNNKILHLLLMDIIAISAISDSDTEIDEAFCEFFSNIYMDSIEIEIILKKYIEYVDTLYLAISGSAHMKYQLARTLDNSNNFFADKALAKEWFQLSAEAGNVKSQYKLGLIYSKGQNGTCSNHNMAKYWYSKAAQQGHQKAREVMSSFR